MRKAELKALVEAQAQELTSRGRQISALIAERVEQAQELTSRGRQISALIAERVEQTRVWEAKLKQSWAVRSALEQAIAKLSKELPAAKRRACNVCGSATEVRFVGRILNKYDVKYLYCSSCGHLQTEKPYWLDEAYASALSASDTGIVMRNERNRVIVRALLVKFFGVHARVLEYAGGHGLLTRMLRDSGVDCHWYDKYASPTFAAGFEDVGGTRYDVVTAFEALEHFEDPIGELSDIFARSDSLVFSQELLPDPVPAPGDWWYYCLEHGQHINFYSQKTLERIAARFDKRLLFHGNIGLLTSLKVDEAAFSDCIEHAEEIAREASGFRQPFTVEDMNAVIARMAQRK